MATYTQQDYARIAAVIGKNLADVMAHQKAFEKKLVGGPQRRVTDYALWAAVKRLAEGRRRSAPLAD